MLYLLWWIHWPAIGSLFHFAMKQETDWSQSRTQSIVTYMINHLHTTVLGPVLPLSANLSAILCSAAILQGHSLSQSLPTALALQCLQTIEMLHNVNHLMFKKRMRMFAKKITSYTQLISVVEIWLQHYLLNSIIRDTTMVANKIFVGYINHFEAEHRQFFL